MQKNSYRVKAVEDFFLYNKTETKSSKNLLINQCKQGANKN